MRFNMEFQESAHDINVKFGSSTQRLDIGFEKIETVTVTAGVEYYEGTYKVIPTSQEHVLETKQKFLVDNVTIDKIPYAEVTNNANGTTVTIG